MAFHKPKKKPEPDPEALKKFVGGANYGGEEKDEQEPVAGSPVKTTKKETAKKPTPKKAKESGAVKEPNGHRYNFLISKSYHEKMQLLTENGVNMQTKLRNFAYPLIDRLIAELEKEQE